MLQTSYIKVTTPLLIELVKEGTIFRRIFSSQMILFPRITIIEDSFFLDGQPISNFEYSQDLGKSWFKFHV